MKIASCKTLNGSAKTRRAYAYNAIERASMEADLESERYEKADKAMTSFINGTMGKDEMLDWALEEKDYREVRA